MFQATSSLNPYQFSATFSGAAQLSVGGPAYPPLAGVQQSPQATLAALQVLIQATQLLSASWSSLLGGQQAGPGSLGLGAGAGAVAGGLGLGGYGAGAGAFAGGLGLGGYGAGAGALAGGFGPGGYGVGAGALAGGFGPGGYGAGAGALAGFGLGGYGAGAGALAGGFGLGGYGAGAGALAGGFGSGDYGSHGGQSADQTNLALALALSFGYQQLPGESQKMWDVWFDSKAGQQTVQRSPLVLDLNKNGKADITGKNITGDGKIDGPTTLFDLDPNSVSYEFKSQQRRPGSGAPAVDGGYWVDPQGNKVPKGPPKGTQPNFNGYRYLDKSGNLVGEMKDGLYNYGKQEKREVTEWLAKDGGDGFLVADLNRDGEINSAVELFGTHGANGEKYQNGYEKLAALFDKNRDGTVAGDELAGLQVWADKNADGKVQQGELQSLQQHDITSFDVGNYDRTTMEGRLGTGGQFVPYLNLAASLAAQGYGQHLYSLPQPSYFPYQPYALPPFAGYF